MDTLPFVRAMREIDTLTKSGDMAAAGAMLAELAGGDLTEKQRDLVSMKQGLLQRQSARVAGTPISSPPPPRPAPKPIPEVVSAPATPLAPAVAPVVEPEPVPEPLAIEAPTLEPTTAADLEPQPASIAEVAATVAPVSEPIIPPLPSSESSDLDDLALPADVESAAIAISARIAASVAIDESPNQAEHSDHTVTPAIDGGKVHVAGDSLVIPAGADAFSTVTIHSDSAPTIAPTDPSGAETVRAPASSMQNDALSTVAKAAAAPAVSTKDPLIELAERRVEPITPTGPGSPGYVENSYREFRTRLLTRAALLLVAAILVVIGAMAVWQGISHKPKTLTLTGKSLMKGVEVGGAFETAKKALQDELDEKLVGENDLRFDRWHLVVGTDAARTTLTNVSIGMIGESSREWLISLGSGEPLSSHAELKDFAKRLTTEAGWTTENGQASGETVFRRREGNVSVVLKFGPFDKKERLLTLVVDSER